MMDIEIYTPPEAPKKKIPYVDPVILGSMLGGLIMFGTGVWVASHFASRSTAAMGGPDVVVQQTEDLSPEERVRRLRTKQAVLGRREEMLRFQLQQLEQDQLLTGTKDPAAAEQLRRSRNTLVMLLKDQEDTDEKLVEFLRQVWEADGKAHVATMGMDSSDRIIISWPVQPTEGISADFEDPFYLERFGIAHEAVDIPVLQGSDVHAAAGGVVNVAANNGMGYNYVIIRHNGFATVYGHVSEILVTPGQEVQEGDVIAKSGGQPGTPGAGGLSTGQHLHFELVSAGQKIDPMPYLPYSSKVEVVRRWRDTEEATN